MRAAYVLTHNRPLPTTHRMKSTPSPLVFPFLSYQFQVVFKEGSTSGGSIPPGVGFGYARAAGGPLAGHVHFGARGLFLGSSVWVSAPTLGLASVSKSAVRAARTFWLLNADLASFCSSKKTWVMLSLSISLSFSACSFQFFSFLLFRCLIQCRSLWPHLLIDLSSDSAFSPLQAWRSSP